MRIDPHELGRRRVLRGGAQPPAEVRVEEQPVLCDQQHHGRGNDEEMLGRQHHPGDADQLSVKEGRHLERIGSPDQQRQIARKDGESDRRDDECEERAIAQRIEQETLEDIPDHAHPRHGHRRGDGVRQACRQCRVETERGQHHELALREVEAVGGVVDQDETEPDQRVDASHRQTGRYELGHGCLARSLLPTLQDDG